MPEDKPFIKNKTQQKLYNNLLSSNLDDILSEGLGLNNPLEAPARSFGQRDAYQELYPEQEFEDPSYTPGRKQGLGHEGKLTGDEVEQFKQLVQNSKNVPNIYVDVPDALGENQSILDKWANGITKFVGKTATNVIGSTVGQVYGLFSAIGNGEFNKFYDNAFQRVLDDANTAMDEALPNYVRKETEEKSLFGQMGTANFWANDFLGGMSFVAGAVLSELATKGLSTPALIARATKFLKLGRVAKAADVASDVAGKGFKAFNVGQDFVQPTLDFARKTIVGAGYEAGVEARHFVDEAKTNYINSYIEQNGRPPSEVEVAAFMDEAHRVGNTVFGINLALVGGANAVTLPKSFGPGLLDRMGKMGETVGLKSGVDDAAKGIVKTSELSTKQLERIAAKTGQSVDEILKTPTINKALAYSTGEKIGRNTFNALKKPFVEGVWEEGMQGSINKGALDYVARTYDEDATNDTMNMGEALLQGMEETYGSSEGWKEIMVGMLIGSTGMVSPGKGGKGLGWQGNIFQELVKNDAKDARVNGLVNMINANPSMIPVLSNNWKAAKQQLVASRNTDKALEENDFFNAKNEQFKAFHSYVAAKVEAGMYDDIIDNDIAEIQKMPEDKFAEEFGYENLTSEELKERKQKVINSVKEQAKNTRDALNHAKRITKSDDWDLNHGLAYTIASIKNADKREEEMAKSFSKALGNIYSEGQVKNLVALNFNTKDNKQLIKQLSNKTKELSELNRKIIESTPKGGGNLAVESNLIKRENQRDELEREIFTIKKELYRTAQAVQNTKGEKLPYTRDFDAFLQDLEIFEQVQNDLKNLEINVGQGYGPAMNPKDLLKDLTRLARQRQQTILEYNLFMTKEGQKDFIASINNLKELEVKNRLSKEQIYATNMMLTDAAKKGATLKDMQTLAFKTKLKDSNVAKPIESSDTEILKNIAEEAFEAEIQALPKYEATSDILKTIVDKFEVIKNSKDTPENKIAALKELKKEIEEERKLAGDNTPLALDIDKFLAEGHIDLVIDTLEAQIQMFANMQTANVASSVVDNKNRIVGVYTPSEKGANPLTPEAYEILNGLTREDKKDLTLKVLDYPEAGKLVDPSDYDGNVINNTPIKIKTGVVGVNKPSTVAVQYNGVTIGFLLDPSRYVIVENGQERQPRFEPNNVDLNDLELFNPEFITLVTDTNGVAQKQLSTLGAEFIDYYQHTQAIWSSIRKYINEGKELPSSIMDYFNLWINSKETYNTSGVTTPEYFEKNNFSLSDKFGPIVFDRHSDSFFEYNKDTKEFKQVTDGADIEDIKALIGEDALNNSKRFRNQFTAAFYVEDGKTKTLPIRFGELGDAEVSLKTGIIDAYNVQVEKFKTLPTGEGLLSQKISDEEFFIALDKNDKTTSATYTNLYISGVGEGKEKTPPSLILKIRNGGIGEEVYLKYDVRSEPKNGVNVLFLKEFYTYIKDGVEHKQYKKVGERSVKSNADLIEVLNNSIKNEFENLSKGTFASAALRKQVLLNSTTGNAYRITGIKAPIKKGNMSEGLSKSTPGYTIEQRIQLRPTISGNSNVNKTTTKQAPPPPATSTPASTTPKSLTSLNAEVLRLVNIRSNDKVVRQAIIDSNNGRITLEELDAITKKWDDENGLTEAIKEYENEKNRQSNLINSAYAAYSASFSTISLENFSEATFDQFIPELDKLDKKQIEELRRAYKVKGEKLLVKKIAEYEDKRFNTPDNSNPTYKLIETGKELDSYENAISNLKGILPSDISVEELEKVSGNLIKSGIAWGAFANSTIYLAKKVGKGTEYHEAFHAVFRALMNSNERSAVLRAAREKYTSPNRLDIKKLKINHPQLTRDELVDLYYEEKLADDFQDFMNKKANKPTGVLARLWNKILKFINWIKGNEANINLLFESIAQGDFKSRPVLNRDSRPTYKLIPKHNGGFLDAKISNNIINKLAAYLYNVKKEKGYYDINDYDFALSRLMDYYEVYGSNPQSPYVGKNLTKEQLNKIDDVQQALDYESEKYSLYDEVSRKTDLIQVVANDNNEEENEDSNISEEEYSVEFSTKDANSITGYSSLSLKMKQYLGFIEIPYDPFGFLKAEELSNSFNNYLDAQELYSAIEGRMVNSLKHEMLPKLLALSKDNPKIAAFANKLVQDINKELNMNIESWRDLEVFDYDTLIQSNSFNLFISSFCKVKEQAITTLSDNNKGVRKVFRSNSKDVQDKIFEKWFKNYTNLPEADVESIVSLISPKLVGNSRDLTDENSLNAAIKVVMDGFSKIGIDLAPGYVRYSLIDAAMKNVDGDLSVFDKVAAKNPNSDFILALEQEHSLFSNVVPITADDVTNIKLALTRGIKNFALDETDEDSPESLADSDGAVGRLKRLALGNSAFDESTGGSLYTNADGKLKTTIVFPNFFNTEAMLLSFPERYSWNEKTGEEDKFFALKDVLTSQRKYKNFPDEVVEFTQEGIVINTKINGVKVSSEDLNTAYNMVKYFQANTDNPLLSGLNSNGASAQLYKDIVFRNFKHWTSDGTNSVSLDTESEFLKAETYKGNDGTTYMALDVRGKLNTMLSYFINNEGIGEKRKERESINAVQEVLSIKDPADGLVKTITKVPFILIQTETKRTQGAIVLPVNTVSSNNRLNTLGTDMIISLVKQEFERISKVQKEIDSSDETFIIEGYHNGKEPRGLDFFNFKYLKDTNPAFYNKMLNAARKGEAFSTFIKDNKTNLTTVITDSLENKYNGFIDMLTEEGMIETVDGKLIGRLLPSYYVNEDGTLRNLDHFFYNQYINSVSYNNLLFGDMAANFKDPIDFVKRMAGANASGPSTGNGSSTVAMIKDEYITDDFTNDPKKKDINTSDAQSYATLNWFKKYLRSLGKNDPSVQEIYKKIDRGIELSKREIHFLSKNAALANPKKTTTFTDFFYGKTSTKILIRNEVSFVRHELRGELNAAYNRLDKAKVNSAEYKEILDLIHNKYWIARPGREKLHSLLNKMEKEEVDLVFRESAVKTQKLGITTDMNNEFNKQSISDEYIREQLVTDGMSKSVIHPTQLIQLITSEQDPSTVIKVNGKDVTVRALINFYDKLIGSRVTESYINLRKSILDNDTPKYQALLDSMKDSIMKSGGDPTLLELFEKEVTGDPKYSLNLPRIITKFENMFSAYLNNGALKQKVSGTKYTLVSDFGYEVLRDSDGKVITQKEFEAAPSNYLNISTTTGKTTSSLKEGYTTSRLGMIKNSDGSYDAECMVSAKTALELGLKKGQVIPESMLKMLGVRIPTDDKHSAVRLTIVDILPGETGNQIVMPGEIIKLSGADFDIDSEFTRWLSTYNTDKVYGDYITKSGQEAYDVAYDEFRAEALERDDVRKTTQAKELDSSEESKELRENKSKIKEINKIIDRTLSEKSGKLAQLKEEIDLLEDIRVLSSMAYNSNDWTAVWKDKENNEVTLEGNKLLNQSIIAKIKEASTSLKEKRSEFQNQKTILTSIDDIIYHLDNKKKLIERNIILKDKIVENTLVSLDIPTTTEQFLEYKNNSGSTYRDVIDYNISKYKSNELDKIKPITIYEMDNYLFEIERALLSNPGINEVFKDPISRDLPEDFREKYYGGLDPILPDPNNINEVNTPTAVVNASNNGAIGQDNVGIAALWNTAFNWLTRHKTSLRFEIPFIKNGIFSFDSYATENNERKNKVNNTQVNMATDNGKENDAAYFNLSGATLPTSLLMVGIGKSFSQSGAFHIQPVLKELVKLYNVVDSPIKSSDEKYLSKKDQLATLKNKYELSEEDYQGVSAELIELSKKGVFPEYILEKALKFSTGKNTPGFTAMDFKFVQSKVLQQYAVLTEISQFIKEFGTVSALLKGIKPTWAETENAVVALKKLGFEIVKKDKTLGYSPKDYTLKKVSDFSSTSKYPIDFSEIFENPAFEGLIGTLGVILNDSKSFFVTQTKDAKVILHKVKSSFKVRNGVNALDYAKNADALKKEFIVFSALTAYKKLLNKKFSFNQLLTNQKSEKTPLLDLHKKMLYNEDFKDNSFIEFVSPSVTDYKKKNKAFHIFKGKILHKLKADSRGKKNPDYQAKLQDDFKTLISQPEGSDAKNYAIQAYEFLLIKDGASFSNDSFVAQLSPATFKSYSTALNYALEAFNGNMSYKDVFGVSKDEFEKRFIELFSRYSKNTFNIRSANSGKLFGKSEQFKKVYEEKGLLQEDGQPTNNPIQLDEDKNLIIDLFANTDPSEHGNFEGFDEEDPYAALLKSPSKKVDSSVRLVNLKHILKSGLVLPYKIRSKNAAGEDNSFTVLGFPKFVYYTTTSKKGETITRLYRRVDAPLKEGKNKELYKVATKALAEDDILIQNNVKYLPVSTIGSKEFKPYAFTVEEWEEFIAATEAEWAAASQLEGESVEVVDSNKINIYAGTGENAELSNFAIRPFEYNTKTFPRETIGVQSVEQAFQFMKLAYSPTSVKNESIANKILETTNGKTLRDLGKSFDMKKDDSWDRNSSRIMKELLLESFKQNPDALAKLLATGNAELTHTQESPKSKWRTEFPKLLMEVREELSNQPTKVKPPVTNTNTTTPAPAKFTPSQENLEKVALLATKRLKESSLSEELKTKLLPRFSVKKVKSLDFINDTLVDRGLEPITFMEINGAKVIDGKLVNC